MSRWSVGVGGPVVSPRMVAGFAFIATAVSTLFAQATLVRWSQSRQPHQRAWTIALALFAMGSAMLAVGATTGWDGPKYRAFYALGAILNVPWLGLGSVYLLAGQRWGQVVERLLWPLSGLAVGVMCTAPLNVAAIDPTAIPNGHEVFGVFPRALAVAFSSVGALMVLVGALVSIFRFVRRRGTDERAPRMLVANACIAIGTLILGSTGTLKGVAGGKDQAFALGVAAGISVIYAGFAVASRNARRTTLPANV